MAFSSVTRLNKRSSSLLSSRWMGSLSALMKSSTLELVAVVLLLVVIALLLVFRV
jgi:hypothetical protein